MILPPGCVAEARSNRFYRQMRHTARAAGTFQAATTRIQPEFRERGFDETTIY